MTPEQRYPELLLLWRAGFERPANIETAPDKEVREFALVASLPEDLLRAVLALDELVPPAAPSRNAFSQLVAWHRQNLPDVPKAVFVAAWGYLPTSGGGFAHPWLEDTLADTTLSLGQFGTPHFAAFTFFRCRVITDFRKRKVVIQ